MHESADNALDQDTAGRCFQLLHWDYTFLMRWYRLRLEYKLEPHYASHIYVTVETKGLHNLSCIKKAGRQWHSMLNDTIWRAFVTAKIPLQKELLDLTSHHRRWHIIRWVKLILWSCKRCLTWDVTVSDTFAAGALALTSIGAGKGMCWTATAISQMCEDHWRQQKKFTSVYYLIFYLVTFI